MFVSICFRGDCKGWAWLDLSKSWTCPSDTNNTWIYDDGMGAYWEPAHDGLHAACIQPEGTCYMMIKSPKKFDYIFQMNFLKTVATCGIWRPVAATTPIPAASLHHQATQILMETRISAFTTSPNQLVPV